MPSRRMIDPAFWRSQSVAALSIARRYFFIGIFSNADDQGRLNAHPALLRSDLHPFDDIPLDEIQAALTELAEGGFIRLYSVQGKDYLQIPNWWTYQRPKWARPSVHPPPEGWTDRVRYRNGNVVIMDNWQGPEGEEPGAEPDRLAEAPGTAEDGPAQAPQAEQDGSSEAREVGEDETAGAPEAEGDGLEEAPKAAEDGLARAPEAGEDGPTAVAPRDHGVPTVEPSRDHGGPTVEPSRAHGGPTVEPSRAHGGHTVGPGPSNRDRDRGRDSDRNRGRDSGSNRCRGSSSGQDGAAGAQPGVTAGGPRSPPPTAVVAGPNRDLAAVRAALTACSVREPTLSELVQASWVSVELVEAWWRYISTWDNADSYVRTASLIERLRARRAPPPEYRRG